MSGTDPPAAPRGLPPMVEKFGDHLDGLRVMSWSRIDDEPPVLVEPTDLRFSFTAAAVHYGLRLLETKHGQASLKKLGTKICQSWVTNDVFPSSTSAPIIRDMERLVNYYTSKLRNNFFTIVIMKTTNSHGENVVADKERRPCQQYTGPENFDDDYYNPKDMGVFLLTKFVEGDEEMYFEILRTRNTILADSRDEETRSRARDISNALIFNVAQTIYHEVAHAFTTFLSDIHGSRQMRRTPEQINYSVEPPILPSDVSVKAETGARGEAGYTFAYYGFGGDPKMTVFGTMYDWDAFKGARLAVRCSVDGVAMEYRIPFALIKKFFDSPEDFALLEFRGELHVPEKPVWDPTEDEILQDNESPRGGKGSQDDARSDTSIRTNVGAMAATSQMAAYRATDMFRIEDTTVIQTFVKEPGSARAGGEDQPLAW